MSKIAVVTGAYQGIGKGIADGLKSAGYTVIYSDVHPEMEGEVYCKCDISKEEDRRALAAFAIEKYGRIDLLVNNAGVACKVRLDVLAKQKPPPHRIFVAFPVFPQSSA